MLFRLFCYKSFDRHYTVSPRLTVLITYLRPNVKSEQVNIRKSSTARSAAYLVDPVVVREEVRDYVLKKYLKN